MRQRVILLLNLAILVANFALALGSSESQVRVLRATSRVAHELPTPRIVVERPAPPFPAPPAGPAPADLRLLRYLGRIPEVDRLSPDQMEAVRGCLDYCCRVLREEGCELVARAADGASLRRAADGLRERLRDNVARSLDEAAIPDERLRSTLLRVVLSSAG